MRQNGGYGEWGVTLNEFRTKNTKGQRTQREGKGGCCLKAKRELYDEITDKKTISKVSIVTTMTCVNKHYFVY